MLRRPVALAALGAGLAGALLGVVLHLALRSSPSAPALPSLHGQAVWSAGTRLAPVFTLPDQTGRPTSLRSERGHTVVLAFMDPMCRQQCPIEGRGLALAQSQVTASQRATLLVVSVNPLATAPEVAVANRKWHLGNTRWLLGDRQQLARVWKAYGIEVLPKAGVGDIVHSTAIYLIDRRGYERAGFLSPFLPQFVADDLRTLS